MDDVIIGKGNLDGKGVFANRSFKKGEVVIKYHLTPLTQEKFESLALDEKIFVHTHGGILYLYSEPERYVNHSSNPNTLQDFSIGADVASRDIGKGEMITTNAALDDR